jgi:hypothetical protein
MGVEEKDKRSPGATLNCNSTWESASSRGSQDFHAAKGLSLLKPLAQIAV